VIVAEVPAVGVLGWSFSTASDVGAAEGEMEEEEPAGGCGDPDATDGTATTIGDEGERGDDGEEESALANLVIL